MRTQMYGQRGYTLVEVVISASLMGIVVGMPLFLLARAQDQISDEIVLSRTSEAVEHLADRIQEELLPIDDSSILPIVIDNWPVISYSHVEGFSGGVQQVGPQRTLSHQLASGESRNGVDDNGDGRVDEGSVLLQETPLSSGYALASYVTALQFTAVPGGLEFTVEVTLSLDGGTFVQRSETRRVTFRN